MLSPNAASRDSYPPTCPQVVMSYTVALALCIVAFWQAPNVAWIQWIAVAAVGASLYGPQMLIGLCGAETVSKSAVSAAQGFLGCVSQGLGLIWRL